MFNLTKLNYTNLILITEFILFYYEWLLMLTSVTDVPLESVAVRTLPPLTAMWKQTKYV